MPDTVLDVSRPHTHDAQGQVKPRGLQDCACAKYSKHRRGYHALGIGFFPFVVDTLGRLHADARRALRHLASRQVARHYQRRGYPGGEGVRSEFQQDCARRARLLVLECGMQQAVAGVPTVSVCPPTSPGLYPIVVVPSLVAKAGAPSTLTS